MRTGSPSGRRCRARDLLGRDQAVPAVGGRAAIGLGIADAEQPDLGGAAVRRARKLPASSHAFTCGAISRSTRRARRRRKPRARRRHQHAACRLGREASCVGSGGRSSGWLGGGRGERRSAPAKDSRTGELSGVWRHSRRARRRSPAHLENLGVPPQGGPRYSGGGRGTRRAVHRHDDQREGQPGADRVSGAVVAGRRDAGVDRRIGVMNTLDAASRSSS